MLKGRAFYRYSKKVDGDPTPKLKLAEGVKGRQPLADFYTFLKETLQESPTGKYALFGDQLYIVPDQMVDMKRLKVLRFGWHLGTNKKNRFEPSHAMALALNSKDVKQTIDLTVDSQEITSYLKGETLTVNGQKRWQLVTVNGFSIGWGKLSNQTLKNHYPKGLRWL